MSPDQSEYVNMFQRNCERLVKLINDFLDFSKIEAGALRLEKIPFRIEAIVEDAVATFRESASRKGIGLEFDIASDVPEWELGDPLRVQQVLVNLLSNALKFTEHGMLRSACARRLVQPASVFVTRSRTPVQESGPRTRRGSFPPLRSCRSTHPQAAPVADWDSPFAGNWWS